MGRMGIVEAGDRELREDPKEDDELAPFLPDPSRILTGSRGQGSWKGGGYGRRGIA